MNKLKWNTNDDVYSQQLINAIAYGMREGGKKVIREAGFDPDSNYGLALQYRILEANLARLVVSSRARRVCQN